MNKNKQNYKSKKITLVTGGLGFIGSHLVDKLLIDKRKIRILARPKPIDTIDKINLRRYNKNPDIEIKFADIRNYKSLEGIMENVDTVFHLAAISRPMKIHKKTYYDVNVKGTINLLKYAKKNKIKRFVHISSVSVLGVSPDGHPLKENEFQTEKHHYGLSKRKGEKAALSYYPKVPITILRPALTYGPRCVVRSIMFRAVKLGFFPLFNKGKAKMEFLYVENLVQAMLNAEKNPKALGEVFNITDGTSYTVNKIIRTIQKKLRKKRIITYFPVSLGIMLGYLMEIISIPLNIYPPFSRTAAKWLSRDMNVYDCEKAKRMLGYKPKVSLEKGIKDSIVWYKKMKII